MRSGATSPTIPTARKTETANNAIAGSTFTLTVLDEKNVFATSNTLSFTSSSFASSIKGAEKKQDDLESLKTRWKYPEETASCPWCAGCYWRRLAGRWSSSKRRGFQSAHSPEEWGRLICHMLTNIFAIALVFCQSNQTHCFQRHSYHITNPIKFCEIIRRGKSTREQVSLRTWHREEMVFTSAILFNKTLQSFTKYIWWNIVIYANSFLLFLVVTFPPLSNMSW